MSFLDTFQKEILPMLKQAPASEMDPSLVEDMKLWSTPPKAVEILYSLDLLAYGSLASGFSQKILMMALEEITTLEGKTTREVEAEAEKLWRHRGSEWVSGGRPDFSIGGV
jgi:hypothetical protein